MSIHTHSRARLCGCIRPVWLDANIKSVVFHFIFNINDIQIRRFICISTRWYCEIPSFELSRFFVRCRCGQTFGVAIFISVSNYPKHRHLCTQWLGEFRGGRLVFISWYTFGLLLNSIEQHHMGECAPRVWGCNECKRNSHGSVQSGYSNKHLKWNYVYHSNIASN